MTITDERYKEVLEELQGANPPDPPTKPPRIALRRPIPNGEWIVTLQLEIDGQPQGQPLVLRYTDSSVSGLPKKTRGAPEDFGYLISKALHEYAQRVTKRKRK